MDVIVKGILDFIQGHKGYEDTVIAGGAVRDEIFNLLPNDYDFCIPIKNRKDLTNLSGIIQKEFGVSPKKNDGYENPVISFVFEGKKIDLIGHYYDGESDKDFATQTIESFDYGLNMVYFNGSQICDDHEKFQSDKEYNEMSLWHLDGIQYLPKAMARFNRFNERTGGNLIFRAPCLSILDQPEPKKKLNIKKTPWNNPPIPEYNWNLQAFAPAIGAGGGLVATPNDTIDFGNN